MLGLWSPPPHSHLPLILELGSGANGSIVGEAKQNIERGCATESETLQSLPLAGTEVQVVGLLNCQHRAKKSSFTTYCTYVVGAICIDPI